MEILDRDCPKCSAVLKFNPKTQNWKCEYCRSSFTIDELKKYDKKDEYKEDEDNSNDVYTCSHCGAKIATNNNTSATFCAFCKSTVLIKDRLTGKFKPDKIILFAIDKEDAVKIFMDFQNKQIFMPKLFNKKDNIDKIIGIYIPYWSYDYSVHGDITFNGTVKTDKEDELRKYIITDKYEIKKKGKLTFRSILLDASLKLNDDLMYSIEPYDTSAFKEYNHSYLSGFFAEVCNDMDNKKQFEKIRPLLSETFENVIKFRELRYSNLNIKDKEISVSNPHVSYCLLPVWLMSVKYKNKDYFFAVNGQTGKVAGDIPPINKAKYALVFVLVYIAVFLAFSLIERFS